MAKRARRLSSVAPTAAVSRKRSPFRGRGRWVAGGLAAVALLGLVGWVLIGRAPATDDGLAGRARPTAPALPTPLVDGLPPEVRQQLQTQYERVTTLSVDSQAGLLSLAEAYGGLGELLVAYDLAGAETALAHAAALQPEEPRWHYLLGYVAWGAGAPDKALARYRQAAKLAPDDVAIRLRLAEALLDNGEPEAARPELDAALAREPDNPRGLALAGRLADASGAVDEAIRAYERVLAVQPAADMVYGPLAAAYLERGDRDKSAALRARRGTVPVTSPDPIIDQVSSLKRGSNVLLLRGGELMARGLLNEAQRVYGTAVASDPTNPMALVDLAQARYQLGDKPGAVAAVATAVALRPTGSEASLAYRALGVYLAADGRPAEAEAALEAAVAELPTDARSHEALADFLRRAGRCAEAVPSYDAVVRLNPRLILARVSLAMCQVRAGAWTAARAGLEASRQVVPDDRDIQDALARVLATAPPPVGDAGQALALAEAAVAGQRAVDTLETLAMAQAAGGRHDAAVATQREAMALAATQQRGAWREALADNLRRYESGQPAVAPWPDFIYQR